MADSMRMTPRVAKDSRERREIVVSYDDAAQFARGPDALGDRFVVTELGTGQQFEIEVAECSQPGCVCDAVIVKKIGVH